MRSPRIREAFGLLTREYQQAAPALSADAARAIRSRVTRRWMARGAAGLAIVALGTSAVMGVLGGDGEELAIPSPVATPTASRAAATFPFEGGPEFVEAGSEYRCGDPAPTPHPAEHDLSLEIDVLDDDDGVGIFKPGEGTTVDAHITQTGDADLGRVSTSGIDLLVVKNGVVVGRMPVSSTDLWLRLDSATATQYAVPLVSTWVTCPEDLWRQGPGIDPGTYEVVAVAKVFSTPESVALGEVLGTSGSASLLTTTGLAYDKNALYLPGSYDCAYAISMTSPARPCLADYTPNAAVDADSHTVTLLYDSTALVGEFSVSLVSEPLVAEFLAPDAELYYSYQIATDEFGTFSEVADFTCGASAANWADDTDPSHFVSVSFDNYRPSPDPAGGSTAGSVFARGVADGSRLELLPGAQFVTLRGEPVTVERGDRMSEVWVQTVVALTPAAIGPAVTADRYTGPQATTFTTEPMAICPGVEFPKNGDSTSVLLAGTWRVTSPTGAVTTFDTLATVEYYSSVSMNG